MTRPQLGLVVAQFDKQGGVVSEMEDSAREAARDRGAEIVATLVVPGAYDTPLAADRLARRTPIDAVAVVGAIVTGDTDHDQVIGHAAADGLRAVALERDTPVTLGITGPGMSEDEAVARVEYGANAVESALDLIATFDDAASQTEPEASAETETGNGADIGTGAGTETETDTNANTSTNTDHA